jgi:hypothetical protein
MEFLQGGRENKIARVANTVRRPAGPWTESVHALLRHVRAVGFTAVPQPLGFDEAGNEIVTFLAGAGVQLSAQRRGRQRGSAALGGPAAARVPRRNALIS